MQDSGKAIENGKQRRLQDAARRNGSWSPSIPALQPTLTGVPHPTQSVHLLPGGQYRGRRVTQGQNQLPSWLP